MTPLRAVAAGTPGRLSNSAAVSTETIWRAQRTHPRGSDYFSCSGDAPNDSRLQARVLTESFLGPVDRQIQPTLAHSGDALCNDVC